MKGISIDTTHTPPPVSLDSTFKVATKIKIYTFYDEDNEGQFEFSSGRSCLLGFADI
jgi:hypothetical protein